MPAPHPPDTPTDHPPGSPGKLAVLADRAARGEDLFHPDDAEGPAPLSRSSRGHAGEATAGLSWDSRRRRWRAQVYLPGKGRVYCGLHRCRMEALRAIEDRLREEGLL